MRGWFKFKLGISPIFFISLFELSFFPTGTSSKARLGIELRIVSILSFIFI